MAKECPNCKAVGKKKYLSYKTDWNANKTAKSILITAFLLKPLALLQLPF
jgi:hypothetical protein